MKRNTLDKQILKALTIGLSASMALQPVTAFAQEADPEPIREQEKDNNDATAAAEKLKDAASQASKESGETTKIAKDNLDKVIDKIIRDEESRRQAADQAADQAAVLGAGRGAGSAILVSTGEAVDASIVDAADSVSPEKEEKTTVDTVAIEDEDTAKAATIPEEAKKGFAWWVLLILAAITGVSAEEYYRRRKEKVREQSEKKDN